MRKRTKLLMKMTTYSLNVGKLYSSDDSGAFFQLIFLFFLMQ